MKDNYIGNENTINPGLYTRNNGKFNNHELQSKRNYNLNSLKIDANSNFIMNTNKLRNDYKENLLKKSDKMKLNLFNRG